MRKLTNFAQTWMVYHLDKWLQNCVNCRARSTRAYDNYTTHIARILVLDTQNIVTVFIMLSCDQGPLVILFFIEVFYQLREVYFISK